MPHMSSSPRHPCPIRFPVRAAACLVLSLALGLACVAEKKPEPLAGNLLVGAKVETGGVPHTDRLVDGVAAPEGDFWDTAVTARFEKPDSHVVWDLGKPSPVKCALLQGDNNDLYQLEGSADGLSYTPLWQAAPVNGAGMRLRQGSLEAATGTPRYLRLSASGGDHLYSVGEIAVFAVCPAGWPKFEMPRAEPVAASGASDAGGVWTISLGLFAVALVAFIVLTRRRSEPPRINTPPQDDNPIG